MDERLRLWQAVLNLALLDAIRSGDYGYFSLECRGFVIVCALGNVDIDWVLDNIKREKMLPIDELIYKQRTRRKDGLKLHSKSKNYIECWSRNDLSENNK